ncbi:MAG TPA: alpha/beta family hydrolase [bacterium]|nr:alpha/beta family hydrolase [bacterium]
MTADDDPETPRAAESSSFVAAGRQLSTLWTPAPTPIAVCALAHGAGAGMTHPFLDGVARGLAMSGISVLRFNFPYMEAGRRVPDGTAVTLGAWAAALEHASQRASGLPVVAAGKSFGGRMASVLAAKQGDEFPAKALVFLAYPLHAPGKPGQLRDAHLSKISRPMLFIQGTRDALARLDLLEAVIQRLGPLARLHLVEGSDHSFHVARAKREDGEIGRALAQVAAEFVRRSLA